MSEIARDSGIVADDDSSETSSMRTCDENCKLSRVQRLRKRFEQLSREQDAEFHNETNWWLEGEEVEANQDEEEEKVEEEESEQFEPQSEHHEEEEEQIDRVEYRKQVSTTSQRSSRSQKSLKSQKSSEEQQKSPPARPPPPQIIIDDDDDVFESADEVEESLVRRSRGGRANLPRPDSITSQTSNVSTTSKLLNIVRELLENEENYVRSLESGIANYITVMNSKTLPKSLRGQKHRVFGNIESIYKFHWHEFLPRLRDCDEEVEQIAELFTRYVTRDFFYGYVIYAINRKRSELSCNYHVHYWKQVQNECGDRLGINSFLLQPIQRLPRYQLLLNELIKDLSRELESNKQVIAACCVAEKSVQRLLDTVNESMSINDVRNCYDIDILCQGKFKKMDEFDIYDSEIRRRYRGKVFLFERCVVYTEALDREYMEYRGHYGSDKLGIIFKEGKSKFKLFAKRHGQREMEFRADLNTVVEWKSAITGMLMDFVAAEKKRNTQSSLKRSTSTKYRAIPDSVRSSVVSNLSNTSNFSIGSSFRSSTSSHSSGTRDSRASHWYV